MKKTVRCKWVYTIKLNPYGSLAHLKAKLVVKRYSGVWAGFYGYLLSDSEDDIYVDPDVISSDIPLAVSSVRYQECLS